MLLWYFANVKERKGRVVNGTKCKLRTVVLWQENFSDLIVGTCQVFQLAVENEFSL